MKPHLTLVLLLACLPFAACGMTGNDTQDTKSVAPGALGSIDINGQPAGITAGQGGR